MSWKCERLSLWSSLPGRRAASSIQACILSLTANHSDPPGTPALILYFALCVQRKNKTPAVRKEGKESDVAHLLSQLVATDEVGKDSLAVEVVIPTLFGTKAKYCVFGSDSLRLHFSSAIIRCLTQYTPECVIIFCFVLFCVCVCSIVVTKYLPEAT